MFDSFFPRPKLFLQSAIGWFFVTLFIWYGFADGLTAQFSLMSAPIELAEGERAPFLTPARVWVYQYIVGCSVLFCIAWAFISRNKWFFWSVIGTTIIMIVSYFTVQVTVFLNDWYGEFYDLIQVALAGDETVELSQYYGLMATVLFILMPYILIQVLFAYFTSHYVFRWRTAMNEYYMSHWDKLRKVEGAAQRVQEDTMRFAGIMEGLGSAFVSSLMTLIAFLPLLWTLSKQVTELPLVGAVNGSMVFIALISAALGTVLLAVVGWKLPGLEFNNQRVEAAYRKELVYGEDHTDRAEPVSIGALYSNVRKNYFRLYFHYMYFNLFRYAYLQGANFIPLIALGPTIVAGVITFGVFQQIMNAFGRVEGSFQYLVNSWTTIVELISIYKRLKAFESAIEKSDMPSDPTMREAASLHPSGG